MGRNFCCFCDLVSHHEQKIQEVECGTFTPILLSATGTSNIQENDVDACNKTWHPYSQVMNVERCTLNFSFFKSQIRCIRGSRSPMGHTAKMPTSMIASKGCVPQSQNTQSCFITGSVRMRKLYVHLSNFNVMDTECCQWMCLTPLLPLCWIEVQRQTLLCYISVIYSLLVLCGEPCQFDLRICKNKIGEYWAD